MSPEAQTGQDIRDKIMMITTTMMMMLLMRSTCLKSSKLGEYLIPKLWLGQMMMKVVTTMTLIMMLSITNTSMSSESNDGMMTKAKSISAGWLWGSSWGAVGKTPMHYRLRPIKEVQFGFAHFMSHFIRVQIFQIDFPLILYTFKYFR